MLSIYAFKLNQTIRLYKKGGPDNRGRSAAALGVLGGTTGLFTACIFLYFQLDGWRHGTYDSSICCRILYDVCSSQYTIAIPNPVHKRIKYSQKDI